MSGMAKTGIHCYRLLAIVVLLGSVVRTQVSINEISGFSLSPKYFNLATQARISATATCGEDKLGRPRSDLYCKLVGGPTTELYSHNIKGQFCEHCNSNSPNKSHPITNAIDGTETWWQSPPLSLGLEYNEVNVTLDLGQLFHVAYVLIKFANSPRPDLWVLERSVDHGRTFTPWQYFAHSKRECIEKFGKQPNKYIIGDDEQICTTEYSRIVPLENGEIVVSLINRRPGSVNFTHSPVLQQFTKATNIRLRFLRTSTLLGHLISKAQRDPTVTRRYYYSIKDISVGGRCVCHGHALECGGPSRQDQRQCDCQHNTCGDSCDRCCPGYHQKPWRPATSDSANECQPCQCHSHATDCYYDPEVERRRASLDIYGRYDGGGVCLNCQHNTAGTNCELCVEGYYRPYGVPRESPTGCIACRCDPQSSQGCEMSSGRCVCRPEFSGDYCNQCADGYYGYPKCIRYPVYPATTKSPSGNIKEPCSAGYYGAPSCRACLCERQGTVPEICTASGRCVCRPGIIGERCDRCHEGFHSFPYCQECRCDGHGVADGSCGPRGECRCRANYAGQQCEQCATGHYGFPYCSVCQCDPEGSQGNVCDPASGQCVCRPGVTGQRCDRCFISGLQFPYCTECQCDPQGAHGGACDPVSGQCVCRPGVTGQRCDRCSNPGLQFPDCTVCQCDPEGSQGNVCDPVSGQCVCRPGVTGQPCDRCATPGLRFPDCTVCLCHPEGSQGGACDPPSGQCVCRPGVTGQYCDRCSNPGLQFPYCTVCQCDPEGSQGNVCDPVSGQCVCQPGVTGQRCDRCFISGLQFPGCTVCLCHPEGSQGGACDPPSGQCVCRPGVTGQYCDRCSNPGLQFPYCTVCQCDPEGSQGNVCDPASGQCVCRPGVTGQRCDRCSNPGLQFPYCTGPTPAPSGQCNQVGSEVGIKAPGGSCVCRRFVEGPRCDRCKPLFWNLARDNPSGCIECMCDDKGTLSGVGECQQETGECYCKPNTCSHSCSICKESHFLLQRKNYFGCQGCQCDVGGAVGNSCDDQTGQCQCRKNVQGRTCDEPETNYYFPSLHHLKVEVENGITPNARPVRFGYDPQVFPQFSWRGYAIMSPAQSEVSVSVHVDEAHRSAFRLLLRYANPGTASVTGRITASRSRGGAGESRDVVFPPSRAPALLTAPGDGFAQPFTLSPGKWNLHIRAEGILLDYLVLLPSDYYEAPILQETVTEPCTYTKVDQHKSCLLYKHVPMERFPSVLGSEGLLSVRGRRRRGRRQARTRRPTADHPEMASISGRQAQLQLMVHVPRPGLYAVVLEYASEVDMVQNVNVHVKGHSQEEVHARANIYSCTYSFLCRSVAVDGLNRVAKLQMAHRTELLLQTSTASFLLHKVYVVPAEEFSMEYVDPKVLCVSEHGRFTDDCTVCVQSQFPSVPSAVLLDPTHPAPRPSGPRGEGVLLKSPQTEVTVSGRVPDPGRYVFVVHTRQTEHTAFPVEVIIDAGTMWKGWLNASFCPAMSGCRSVFIAERRIALDVPQRELAVTLRIPPGKTLTLDYILAVPDDRYTPDLLKAKPLDKAPDFIAQCGGESFQIDAASEFCRASARSLVARYHDGALPCYCDKSGSTSPTCEPLGGQCPCRPHVIGRQCTRCATGHYGFPYCRPCQCGRRRLCDEVTGACICPPQTVRPACDSCNSQTFSYHPLVGCDHCDCSPTGIVTSTGDCDSYTGQCTCKPRIGGRQCDRCAAGYFRFPECVPCNCETGGVRPEVCDPNTGQCLCKRNVEGERCNSCRSGSFHFDPANPAGCIECFCFRATDQCHSSSKRRGKFVDMHDWRLEKADLEEVPSVLNPTSNTVVADVQEVPRSVQSLHWVAPPSYLGDRVSSYGGYLTYQTKSFGIPSEGMLPLDKKPDVLLSGDQMTLVYFDPQSPDPDRLYQGRVQLVEGNLRHAGTRRPVSRQELLRVLAALEDVRVRALYFTQSQRLSLGDVGLEEASRDGRGAPASTVEECSCPPHYSGDSCQKCASGFYRDRSTQLPGRCVPCSCNGLSDKCEEGTGRCLNCQHNAAGDHCERCQEGYYGNPAQRSCRLCPCPLAIDSNSFATGCREVSGRMQCICKPGYTGERCQSCAPGYYGDPMAFGSSCRPCNCNGNPGHCDSRTGVCKNTLEPKDTNTDEQCQECDNCAQTLLNDLEKLDDELARIKSQLQNANASSSSKERLRKLEEAIAATKNVVSTFTSTVNRQKSKVTDLELDTETVKDDIDQLKKRAEKKKQDVDQALDNVEDTNQRAQNLNSQAQNMFKKIQDLLRQLQDASANGDSVAPDQLTKMLEEAERLVREMEGRNLNDQKNAAEKEKELARKFLDHIQNNVTNQCDQNKDAATRVEGLLKDFEDRLKDLEEALTQAKNLVQKANNQNNLNSQAMQDLLKRIKDLEKERDNVAGQIAMAKDQLKDTENLLSTLDDSKQEYERLAAQVDGAKNDLTKRVNEISKAAAKEAIVKQAEEHAQKLKDLADRLEKVVKDSRGSDDVRNALDAINAYKSIVDAIKAAEEAANEAKEAADKASKDVNQKDLIQKAKDLKDKGDKLVNSASKAEKDLKQANSDLVDQKKRLEDAKNKKQSLENDLQKAQDDLRGIQRDDIANMIDEAKKAASAANDTATDAMGRLDDIKKEVEKISVGPGGDSNLDKVLNEVDNSVKNLTSTIPSLLDKINQIEELSTQAGPVTNVSENIKRIKELIEQARDAANRVTVPMKFKGDSHVELRAPKNMDDLKAYTSLSLYLQRPDGRGDGKRRRRQIDTGDLFVLYLGKKDASSDYIGMALRSNVLYTVYKLNGVEYEIKSDAITPSDSEQAFFDKVDLFRIYQDAEVIMTKAFTSNNPLPPASEYKQGQHIKNLLNIDPKDVVFYVGGYPDSFTPPASIRYPQYKGCIELSSFNERFISLYNFKNAVNIKETPCKRYVPSVSTDFFEGTGYAKVDLGRYLSANLIRLSQFITTRSENGMVLYIGKEDSHYSISLEKGHFVVNGHVNGQDIEALKSDKKYTPLSQDVMVILSKSDNSLKVIYGRELVFTAKGVPGDFKDFYIGGVPEGPRDRFNIRVQPLKACVKTVKVNGGHADLIEKVGVSKGCPEDFLASRKAECKAGGSLDKSLDQFNLAGDILVSLGFRGTESNGLLLTKTVQGAGLELAMVEGHVVMKFVGQINKEIKSKKQYQDGQWHYLTVKKQGASIELLIDESDSGEQQTGTPSLTSNSEKVTLGVFKGCFSNIYTRRSDQLYRPQDLSTFTTTGEVFLDECAAERPPENMLASRNHSFSRKDNNNNKEENDFVSGCSLPTQLKQAYYLGGVASGLTYKVSKQDLQNKPHFSVDVRTTSAEGLLFYVGSDLENGHLALYMSKGRIRLSVRRKREIFNRERYNDGKWHTVIFSLEKKRFRLLVDGIRAQDGVLSHVESSDIQLVSPLYLGSAPPSLHDDLKWKNLPKEGVVGCIRNFKMNGLPVGEPTTNHGAGPCFDGQTESGSYFSGNGGYVIIDESFVVGESFELVFEVRPRNLTGVLLHVGNQHHLSLYMRRGEVVAQVNNGAGIFSVSARPKQSLCDGVFHRVAVIKRKNVVEMHVDTDGNYTIGSASSTTTMTEDPLYVGGIPGTFKGVALPVRTSFRGCIQNMQINGELVAFERLPKVFGSVNLRECPAG